MNARELPRDGASPRRIVNSIEFLGNGDLLLFACSLDIAVGADRFPERNIKIRLLFPGHLIAEGGWDGQGLLCDAGDLGGAGLKAERSFGDGRFPALGKDPHESPRLSEQPRREHNPCGPVRGLIQIDAEPSDEREKGQFAEVLRVHKGVTVGLEQVLREVQDHERVPPRRVVRDDEDGRVFGGILCGLEASDKDFAEGFVDAGSRVPCEPRVKQGALPGWDHGFLFCKPGRTAGPRVSIVEGSA